MRDLISGCLTLAGAPTLWSISAGYWLWFSNRISRSSDWPQIYCVVEDDLELWLFHLHPPSAESEIWITMPVCLLVFISNELYPDAGPSSIGYWTNMQSLTSEMYRGNTDKEVARKKLPPRLWRRPVSSIGLLKVDFQKNLWVLGMGMIQVSALRSR